MLARVIAVGGSALLVLAAIYGVWRFWTYDAGFFHNAAAALPEQLAAAKAEGLPLVPDDLRRNPPVPADQNAADIYNDLRSQVNALFSSMSIPDAQLISWVDSPSPATLSAAKAHLKTLQPVLTKLDMATKRPHLDFNRKYERGPELMFPEYGFLKSATRVLSIKAQLDYADGRKDEALRSLRAAFKVGEHCGEEPVMIAMLVQVACDAIAIRAADHLASAAANDAPMLSRLEKLLQSLPYPPSLAQVFKAELVTWRLCCYRYSVDQIGEWFGADDEEAKRQKMIRVDDTVRRQAYDARVLELGRRIYAIFREHSQSLYGAGAKIDKLIESMDGRLENDPSYYVSEVGAHPMYNSAEAALKKAEVRRQLLFLKIGALQYRNTHGRYTSDLVELGTNVRDPLSELPVVIRATPHGFRAYSVGANRRDDGGVFQMPRQDDILVEHPIKPKQKKP